LAESHELSEDKRTYTFHIRQGMKWSNGDPVTAHDWTFSWLRFLHPDSAAEYSYQLWYLKNAEKYSSQILEVGDRVEVEENNRIKPAQLFPRGTIISGVLAKIDEIEAKNDKGDDKVYKIFHVDCVPTSDNKIDWEGKKTRRIFFNKDAPTKVATKYAEAEAVNHVLFHFSEVGLRAIDDHTLEVELENPTPYFLELVAFYPLYPVNRRCIETHGFPYWTKAENIVVCGPYDIEVRRIRDRIRLQKNPHYWDADNVKINTIDALAVQSEATQLNMYMAGQLDWATTVPNSVLPELRNRDLNKKEKKGRADERADMLIAPMLTTYFYRVNTTRPPLDNPKVREALNLAIDKQEIVDFVTKGGQIPATTFVPPGLTGYESPDPPGYDPKRAKELLAEAGYPGGKGLPPIQILYNTNEGHKSIAEVIQQQWKRNLQIDVQLKNLEWGVFLNNVRDLNYDVARAGWIADYPDPNTFLDMFLAGGANNQTGWENAEYDRLIKESASESDPKKRLRMLHNAEEIFVKERPILPVYFYVSVNMVRPYVKNFYPNLQDLHPLHILEIDEEQRDKIRKLEGLE